MLGLLLVVATVIAHFILSIACVVKSVRVRHRVAMGAAVLALATMPLSLVPFPHVSPIVGVATLVASGVVVGVTWRRKATLPMNDPAIEQADAVTGTFLLLGIIGAIEVIPFLAAKAFDL
jgi:hypothetical protein